MKKLVLVLVLLMAVSGAALFAQTLDLSAIPAGSWFDPTYNAIWTFSATGIVLTATDDPAVNHQFNATNIQNFRPVSSGRTMGVGFSSSTHGRSYAFFPNADGSLNMQITREGQPQYSIQMQRRN